MKSGQEKTPVRGQAQPGLVNRSASAAGNQIIAREASAKEAGTPYHVTSFEGDAFRIVVAGRVRWALDRLMAAGAKGCTPINEPAPRWSAYIHKLREFGVEIETVIEAHGGEFAGHHARYVLRSRVVRDSEGRAA